MLVGHVGYTTGLFAEGLLADGTKIRVTVVSVETVCLLFWNANEKVFTLKALLFTWNAKGKLWAFELQQGNIPLKTGNVIVHFRGHAF